MPSLSLSLPFPPTAPHSHPVPPLGLSVTPHRMMCNALGAVLGGCRGRRRWWLFALKRRT
eukprot:171753-Rhodomonas_salina.1